jgi:signal transduction histidine kinase
VSAPRPDAGALGPAPYRALRERLAGQADALERAGAGAAAASLRAALDAWWQEQSGWDAEAARALAVHHEIANALVGVRGHAQLLLMGPAGQQPGVRERLEVVMRESGRIQEATGRIRELKAAFGGGDVPARAA